MKTASSAFLAVMVISSLGIWGCAQQKSSSQAHKIRDLEARYAKLEDDYRVLLAANDSTRKKVAQMELQRSELLRQVDELKVVAQDREDLKEKLNTRTAERNNAQAQLLQFSKELLNLASRAETAANGDTPPTLTVVPASRKNR